MIDTKGAKRDLTMLKIKKIKPLFNKIIVTADKYKEVKVGTLIDATKSDTIKEYQKVISVGSTVRDIKEGDLVLINPSRYAVRKHKEGSMKDGVISDNPVVQYNFNMVEIDGSQYLLLYDSDIDYIVEDYEDISDETPKKTTLQIDTPKIIV